MIPLLLIASDVMIPTEQINVQREERLGSKSINKCLKVTCNEVFNSRKGEA